MALNLFSSSSIVCLNHGKAPTYHQGRTFHCIPRNRKLIFPCRAQVSHSASARRSSSHSYRPTSWTYNFVQSLKNDNADEMYKEKAGKLEEVVRGVLNNGDAELLTTLEIIDDIQRLGLKHRFEEDIKRKLDQVFSDGRTCKYFREVPLHATALGFRLLRQHGYEISQDVFGRFTDEERNFMTCNIDKDDNIKGMMSLYEASFLSFEGEDLLDKAFVLAKAHLISSLSRNSNSSFVAESLNQALELSLHRKIPLLAARNYIESCSKKDDVANPVILELAKLNFNMVQSVLKRDLQEMSRWWNELGLANKLGFARDRLVECFFWSLGMVSEPGFSSCRKGLTKVISFITVIDDIYDVHGTMEELELFTDAVDKWDVTSALENLPDYMKICFLGLYNTVNEMAYGNLKEQGANVLPCLTKEWADLCKAFLQEARWTYGNVTPSFEDYFDNAWRSSSGCLVLKHAYFLLSENMNTKQEIDRLMNHCEMLRWPSIIFRLCNDLSTSSVEASRGETANAISCYMNKTGFPEELALDHMNRLNDQAWKKMNQSLLAGGGSPFTKRFTEATFNLARVSHCVYQHGDGHGAPDRRSKSRVESLIIEPFPVNTQFLDQI